MMIRIHRWILTLLLEMAVLATPGLAFQNVPVSIVGSSCRSHHPLQRSSGICSSLYAAQQQEQSKSTEGTTTSGSTDSPTDSSNGQEEGEEADVKNLRVPQVHLPPRLAPGVAWQHHHRATVQLVRDHTSGINKQQQPTPQLEVSAEATDEEADAQGNPVGRFLSNIGRSSPLVSASPEWKRLQQHAKYIQSTHLRDLLQDTERCQEMYATHDGVYLDYSRQRADLETMRLLFELAEKQNLKQQIEAMFDGEKINFTEERAVLHTALRADRSKIGTVMVDGVDAVQEVHEVLDQIQEFTQGVRSGAIRGYTGKRLRNIVSVGIGGSYLGPEFLHEVLKTEPEGSNAALGYSLRFLANVDPVDVERTCADLDPEETMIVIVSKTFTTAETMLNARTMRQWLWDFMGNDKEVVRKHFVACASVSATDKVRDFGIDTENRFFRFWDWVGGRYSVCSAAGAVPLSLLYGFDLFEKFLQGARSMDEHFRSAPMEKNIPILMGLLGVWNMSFLGYNTRTTLPYAEALLKLPAHIQQLDMESNGKSMTKFGIPVDYPVGEIDFGEPGTNGQHSFYQLLHMGQTVACDFIGFVQSQQDLCLDDEKLSSHDELMANFFAQPDALATGKTAEQVRSEGVKDELIPHKVFEGNRPSISFLLPKLTAYATGQLLSMYEHRTATQGFIWDINSFDQWGVELGKKLAIDIRNKFLKARNEQKEERRAEEEDIVEADNPATERILNYYVKNSAEESGEARGFGRGSSGEATSSSRKSQREHVPPERNDLCGKNGKLSR
ncbi:Glucose-6-phosphate isomerase [Seminavis robusta]|uniref:Glucose-6-phosphate isomerase n=1 Tax=Seminavis robusta TaxID=568900 RepID=A0A9N8H904_9STRA|nr:Glucose-6-phosphate isomerase [Seminavis robusta]|eukprot:Sro188_g081100.1 Glucose-6-phosphate isomerase (783) ;mRNA; r:16733-19349